jgi:hypothetical protein
MQFSYDATGARHASVGILRKKVTADQLYNRLHELYRPRSKRVMKVDILCSDSSPFKNIV